MTRVPHGFWLANLAVAWAAFFTASAMFVLPVATGSSPPRRSRRSPRDPLFAR